MLYYVQVIIFLDVYDVLYDVSDFLSLLKMYYWHY